MGEPIKRYSYRNTRPFAIEANYDLVADADGDWVKYADHEAALAAHQSSPDPSDPDGWIRRSALNQWSERALAAATSASALRKENERLLHAIDHARSCLNGTPVWLEEAQETLDAALDAKADSEEREANNGR